MAHAATSDWVLRVDPDILNDLANKSVRQSRDDLLTNSVLTTCLDDASGEIDASVRRGGRYSETDLSGLTGNSLAHLKRLCCDIATSLLLQRRPGVFPELAEAYGKLAREHKASLAKGEDVFDVETAQSDVHPTVLGPTRADDSKMNHLLSDKLHRFLPVGRHTKWPIYRE